MRPLDLDITKTKEIIVDFRRSRRTEHSALSIHGEEVERVESFKFLTWGLIYKGLCARKCCGNRDEMCVRIFHRQRRDL
ncbi:hypothetical protein N1851_008498 [Merluccius polli]|uniref:Uncharacterized protein n=1 Tax=Merluccius polli TaxID=89951 RepID=A0AA47N1C2_MERPO|nr:hypothetical protein N1851_008498 [Merluccius polli]